MKEPPLITVDSVLKILMDLELTDQEMMYRGVIQTVAKNPDNPQTRDLVIALVATLLSRSGQPWPHILCAVNALRGRTDEQLRMLDAVAIVNGDRMILPGKEDRSVRMFDLVTLREVEQSAEPSLVMTIYSLPETWKMVMQSLTR